MNGTVTVSRDGRDQDIPLGLLELGPGFSDAELKSALASLLKAPPEAFAAHQVVRDAGRIRVQPHTAATDRLVVHFLVWSALFFLIGTVQGVVQVMPEVRRWIMSTGGAGHLIDPLAHAHVNLVGGVVMVAIGATYYLLPRVLKRPLWSLRLARLSLIGMAAGVLMWYLSMVTLGLIEGRMMLAQGIGFLDAKEAVQPWHTLGFVIPATVMGIGHWLYIANVFLTVLRRGSGRSVPGG
jgi:cbb3-type cytochrome oxidase subunit 1